MFNKIKQWLKQKFACEKENRELIECLQESASINKGLVFALGKAADEIDSVRNEALFLLTAIAFKHGGQLVIGSEFFEAIADDTLKLLIEKQDNNNVIIRFAQEEDKTDAAI